jgi:hypothetical protein
MKDLIQRCAWAYIMGLSIFGGVMLSLLFGVLGMATTVTVLVLRAC